MKTTIVYKVMQKTYEGKLISCCRNPDFPEKLRLEYKAGVKTKDHPFGNGIFCFLTLEEARKFADQFWQSKTPIWKCKTNCKPIKKAPLKIAILGGFLLAKEENENLKSFLSCVQDGRDIQNSHVVGSLTPIEEVK